MKKLLLAALVAYCTGASATVLTFDDIPAGLNSIPDGYGGLNWNNDAGLGVFSRSDIANAPLDPGYANGIYSGDQAAFNFGGESPATITVDMGGATFSFSGAYFTSSSGSQDLTIVGLRNGAEVGRTTATIINRHDPASFLAVNLAGIDTLQIISAGAGDASPPPWVMDDFTYTAGAGDNGGGDDNTPVPEPLSLSLMGLGLAALGVARRRKA